MHDNVTVNLELENMLLLWYSLQ